MSRIILLHVALALFLLLIFAASLSASNTSPTVLNPDVAKYVQLANESSAINKAFPRDAIKQAMPDQVGLAKRLDRQIASLEELAGRVGLHYCGLRWEGDLSLLPEELRAADPNDPNVRPAVQAFERNSHTKQLKLEGGLPLGMLLFVAYDERGLLTDNVDDLQFVLKMLYTPDWRDELKVLSYIAPQRRERLVLMAAKQHRELPAVAWLGGSEAPVVERQGELYLPANALRSLGFSVTWNPQWRVCEVSGVAEVALQPGSSTAHQGGHSLALADAPMLSEGRLLLSAKDLGRLFGLKCNWSPAQRVLRVSLPKQH